ncbi:type II secretion system protein [Coraliomargarita sp. W4R53]
MLQFNNSNKRAFTLIELLVVIAVIAILSAILLPVVSKVRDRAAGVKSLSNLRQVGTAMGLYLNDHGGDYPHWIVGTTPTWYNTLSEDGDYGLSEGGGTKSYSEVFYSPLSGKDGGGGWPNVNTDYGINLSVVNKGSGGNITPRKANAIKQPAELALVVSTGNGGNALRGDFRFVPVWYGQLENGFRTDASSYTGYAWLSFRYPAPSGGEGGDMGNSSAVMLFCDGHVELVPFEDSRLQTQAGRRRMFVPE